MKRLLLRRYILISCVFLLLSPFLWAGEKNFRDKISITTENQDLNEMRALKLEMMVSSSEKKALKQLNYLITKYKGTAMEPGLWFRKAELYMRRAKTDRFFSIHRESSKLVRLLPKVAKRASTKRNLRKAVNTYDHIQRKFPRYIKLDLVYFNNAFARQQLKQDKTAENLYRRMLREFPDSPLVAETYLALGEMYFQQNKFKKAIQSYENIKKYPESRIYPYGRYKLGWAYYNLGWNQKALTELEIVVNLASKKPENQLNLKREALGDMVLFYSDVLPASKAVNYFRKYAGDNEAGTFLLGLARLYQRHSKFKELETVLTNMIADMPYSAQTPMAYRDLVEAFEAARNRTKAVNHLQDMHRICAKDSSWTTENINKHEKNILAYKQTPEKYYKPNMPVCQKILDRLTSNLGLKWDRMSKKNKTYPVFAKSAEIAYKLYLERGLGKKKTNSLRYSLSELLFRQKKYREASQQYFLTAESAKEKKRKHDASYSAIFSLQKAVKDKWKNKEDELEYVRLSSFYIDNNPNGKYVENVEFKRGFIIYENARYDEAAPYLKNLGTKYANKTQGKKAQDLYLDILNIKKDYTGIKNYASNLLKLEKDGTRKESLKSIYQQAYFSEVQTFEKAGEKLKAIESYQKFAKRNKKSELAHKAWWNSIQLLQKQDLPGRLAQDSYKFTQMFPSSSLVKDALVIAAKNYESTGLIEEALLVCKQLKKKDKENYFKWLALEAEYEYIQGDLQKSEKLFIRLAESKYTKKKDRFTKRLLSIASLEKKNQDLYRSRMLKISHLNVFPSAATALAELAAIAYKNKNYPKSFKTASAVLKNKKVANKMDLAHARYIQGLILAKEFYAQSVKSSKPERIAMVLAIKTEKLDKAQRALQATINYNYPVYGVLALEEMASLYGHYSQAVRSMKLPKSIPEKEAQAFYQEMENLAIPMEEKEVETLQVAVEQSKNLEIRDGTSLRLLNKIKKLNMQGSSTKEYNVEVTDVVLPMVKRVGS